MDAGTIITSQARSRLDNTGHLKPSLELTMGLQQTSGPSLVWSSRWLLETSSLNLGKDRPSTRMMTILRKWWRYLERCQRTWHFQARMQRDSSILQDTWWRSEDFSIGQSRKCLWRSIRSEKKRLRTWLDSSRPCLSGTLKDELQPRRCSNTLGSTWPLAMTTWWMRMSSREWC